MGIIFIILDLAGYLGLGFIGKRREKIPISFLSTSAAGEWTFTQLLLLQCLSMERVNHEKIRQEGKSGGGRLLLGDGVR